MVIAHGTESISTETTYTFCSWELLYFEHVAIMNESKSRSITLTLYDLMDYTVHGILQGRILEWVSFCFSRRSSKPRDWTQVSCIAGGFFTSWAIRETQLLWIVHLKKKKKMLKGLDSGKVKLQKLELMLILNLPHFFFFTRQVIFCEL